MTQCKCGSKLFYENRYVYGWWECMIDGDGEIDNTNLDKLNYGKVPKTVKCVECGKVNPNPRYERLNNERNINTAKDV